MNPSELLKFSSQSLVYHSSSSSWRRRILHDPQSFVWKLQWNTISFLIVSPLPVSAPVTYKNLKKIKKQRKPKKENSFCNSTLPVEGSNDFGGQSPTVVLTWDDSASFSISFSKSHRLSISITVSIASLSPLSCSNFYFYFFLKWLVSFCTKGLLISVITLPNIAMYHFLKLNIATSGFF